MNTERAESAVFSVNLLNSSCLSCGLFLATFFILGAVEFLFQIVARVGGVLSTVVHWGQC